MENRKRKNQSAQEEIRYRIVAYLKKKLGTQKQAAEIFSVTERSVNKVWNKYKRSGLRSLQNRKRGVRQKD